MMYAFLLDVSLKTTILLAAASVATLAMCSASAAARHLVWCCAMAAVLCVPVLSAVLPAWRVLPHAQAPAHAAAPPVEATGAGIEHNAALRPAPAISAWSTPGNARSSFDAGDLIASIWIGGASICLLPMLIGWWRLRRVALRCQPVTDPAMLRLVALASSDLGLHRPTALLMRDRGVMPMTWGFIRPTVLLPRESAGWPHDRCRAVLLHELAHVKRLDCLTHLIGQFARAAYWFNPLVWMAVWRMSVERERACDDLVLRAGVRQSDYARELLTVGTSLPPAPRGLAAMAMAMARPSRMERRLRDVLDEHRNRRPLTRRQLFAAAAVVALVTIPMACIKSRGAEDSPASQHATLPPAIPPERMSPCQKNLAILVRAVHAHAKANEGKLPRMIGSTADEIFAAQKHLFPNDPAQPLAHYYLCDTDDKRREAPQHPDPQWLSENTLYRYLGSDLTGGFAGTDSVMIYEDLDWKGHGNTINVGFWDGSVRAMDRVSAARAIEATRARIDAEWAERAARTDLHSSSGVRARTPILVQASSNMKHVGLALAYYALEHDQTLPPTLGDALPYGNDELSIHSKARTYLLPQDQHGIIWPATPTAEWINEHTSYVYLGADVNLKKLPKNFELPILHTKPLKAAGGENIVLLGFVDGHVEAFILKGAEPLIEKSKKALDAARGS